MERLKEQLLEVEKQRDEHNNTIGKLRQVKIRLLVSSLDRTCLFVCLFTSSQEGNDCFHTTVIILIVEIAVCVNITHKKHKLFFLSLNIQAGVCTCCL